MSLAAHGVTHPGRRTTNEDAFLVDANRGLFVVADGMGGHNAAKSRRVSPSKPLVSSWLMAHLPASTILDEALRLANDHILTVAGEADYTGMGTTVAVVYLRDGEAIYAHAGDSRVYLWHKGRDHSAHSRGFVGRGGDERYLRRCPRAGAASDAARADEGRRSATGAAAKRRGVSVRRWRRDAPVQ
jgi:serine/threonine protein phosphatase PrpC